MGKGSTKYLSQLNYYLRVENKNRNWNAYRKTFYHLPVHIIMNMMCAHMTLFLYWCWYNFNLSALHHVFWCMAFSPLHICCIVCKNVKVQYMRRTQMITYASLLFRNMLVVRSLEFSTSIVGRKYRVPNESILNWCWIPMNAAIFFLIFLWAMIRKNCLGSF